MLRSSSVCDTNCTCGIIKLLHASQCLKYGGIYNIISLPKWVVIAHNRAVIKARLGSTILVA